MFVRTASLLSITRRAALPLLACLLFAAGAAFAQDADPPGRIARLSDAEGSVALQPAGVATWGAAQLNRPVTTGDRLWSDKDSRAELDLGSAAVRLGSGTAFSFFNLDDRAVQMQLTAGTLIVHVREIFPSQLYEIDTPNLALALLEPGEYRVEVNDAGDTTVVRVSEGRAHVEGGGQSVTLGMQQMARFSGRDILALETGPFGVPDDFDAWSAARERGLMNSSSADYLPQGVPGAQDLDENGTWELTPEYGYVWAPVVVVVDWAPYRFGHWVFIAPWGWTWIDDAPWGFAPYHYGRWVVWNSAWCWVPGPKRLHPVYAPAVVGWVGGPGRRAGALGPNVGWFPLAPHEVYVPPYRVSAGYARALNLTNTAVSGTQVANVYQNNAADVRYLNARVGSVTAVPQAVFAAGERVRGRTVPLSSAALAGTTVAASAPPIMPLPQSVFGAGPHAVSHPPAAYLNRPVLVRTEPPRAPASFDRQLSAMQAAGGEVLTPAALARLQPPAAAAPVRVLPRSAQPLPAAVSGAVPMPTLAERERALQTSTLGGPPPNYSYRVLPQDAAAGQGQTPTPPQGGTASKALRTDRPPAGSIAAGSGGSPSRNASHQPAPGGERYRAPVSPAAPPALSHPGPPTPPPARGAPPAAPAHASSVHVDAVR